MRVTAGLATLCCVCCACCALCAASLGGCATQREQRLSSAEARERPTDEPCERPPERRNAPKPGAVWSCGYWHWDSVHYVWVDGHWQEPAPGPAAGVAR